MLLVRWLLKHHATVKEIEEALGIKIVFEDRPCPSRTAKRHKQYHRRHGA